MNNKLNENYSINRISILKPKVSDLYCYLTIDIETFNLQHNIQIPYAVAVKGSSTYKILQLHSYLDNNKDIIESSHKMINDIIDYLLTYSLKHNKHNNKYTIYAHNLGSFDGYFILKSLIKRIGAIKEIKFIIDNNDNIVELRYKNLIFRDSYRIFPASLSTLGEICGLNLVKFDFNFNVTIFDINNSEFQARCEKYIKNDVDMLYEIISYFKEELINTYNIRLKDVYSTSNMAFKVFRTKFLKESIHSSTIHEYNLIKPCYYGGSVQIYNNIGKDLYYYDVNSLYPYAMLKPLPIKYLSTVKNISVTQFLEQDYFGFVDCEIYIPDNISKPQVPFKYEGKIIYPHGKIIGRYFTEEVKA